ncbi:hypothetical protein BJV77DRAFT_1022520 [Russula vinacea]|nr:hypothetical protein BJV77DRAFT_1022520 [Russula vinacea]
MCRLLAPVSLVGPLVSFAGPLVSLSNISTAFSSCDTRSHSPSCSRTARPPKKPAPDAVLLEHHARPRTVRSLPHIIFFVSGLHISSQDELCVILRKTGVLLLHPPLSSSQLPTLLAIETIQLWPCTITFPPSRNVTGSSATSIMFNGTCHDELGRGR